MDHSEIRTPELDDLMQRWISRAIFLPTLAWNFLLGRILKVRRWWDRVDEHVIMGALPFWFDVPAMHDAGVGAVVNTCEEYAGPTRRYEEFEIVQLRIPTVDFTPPQLDDVVRAVDFMEEQISQGRQVYVHCKAGRARSGTVVLCWMIRARGLTPEQAQAKILECRPHANPRLAQREVVRQFWARETAE